MKYYSINKTSPATSLRDAVIKGLAPDKGLYMPEIIKRMPDDFFNNMTLMLKILNILFTIHYHSTVLLCMLTTIYGH